MSAHCLPARRLTAARESTWPADQLMAVPAASRHQPPPPPVADRWGRAVDGRRTVVDGRCSLVLGVTVTGELVLLVWLVIGVRVWTENLCCTQLQNNDRVEPTHKV